MKKSSKRWDRLFVTATDTGVGKTVLALLLMQFFSQKGAKPFYIKPIQTGCRNVYAADSDSKFIYAHVAALKEKDPADAVVYCFKNPKAPLFAARDEGRSIDPKIIKAFVDEKSKSYSPLILEGAGGLLVPVWRDLLMIDLICMLDAAPLLVCRAGLGTINHTLLSLEALQKRRIVPAGLVFMDAGKTKTPPEMIRENIAAIEEISASRVAGVIGEITDFDRLDKQWCQTLGRLCG